MTDSYAIAVPAVFSRLISFAAQDRRAVSPWRLVAGVGIEIVRFPEHGNREFVLVTMAHAALSEVFAGGPWGHGGHVKALSGLPDAFVPDGPIALQRGGRSTDDVVAVPLDVLQELQFATERAAIGSMKKTLRWWWPSRHR
jgi:hypothetical protein